MQGILLGGWRMDQKSGISRKNIETNQINRIVTIYRNTINFQFYGCHFYWEESMNRREVLYTVWHGVIVLTIYFGMIYLPMGTV
jgi:hypothetical protein